MFAYKCWLDTRWRFLIGLCILLVSAAGIVLVYPRAARLLAALPTVDTSDPIGRRIQQSAELMRSYRGYLFGQWFDQSALQQWTLFAVLLGSGGLISSGSESAALFTLSLPLSRREIIGTRAVVGLAELAALALVPSLLIVVFSPAVGERYSVVDALVHGGCLLVAGSAFFNLALLLSTVFHDVWRPLLFTIGVAVALSLVEQVPVDAARFGIFHVMSGDTYFRSGAFPWVGLLAAATVSAGLFYGASTNLARRDF